MESHRIVTMRVIEALASALDAVAFFFAAVALIGMILVIAYLFVVISLSPPPQRKKSKPAEYYHSPYCKQDHRK